MQIGTAAKEQLHIESCRFQNHYIIKETGINLLPDIENTHEDNKTHTGKITESQNSNQEKSSKTKTSLQKIFKTDSHTDFLYPDPATAHMPLLLSIADNYQSNRHYPTGKNPRTPDMQLDP